MLYFVANWKSNKNLDEARQWFEDLQSPLQEISFSPDQSQIIVAVPFPFIFAVSDLLSRFENKLTLAVQTASGYEAGAYTGEIAHRNLEGSAVTHVLCGHSERRQYNHEAVQDVARQVDQAIQHNRTPILCVDKDTWKDQLSTITETHLSKTIVAYEPNEAIGTGKAEDLGMTLEVVKEIRSMYGDKLPILYGGSVTAENVHQYTDGSFMNGVLVGSASLESATWANLVKSGIR